MKRATRYMANTALRITDQRGDPDAADLGWCIRRRWRVIYYTYRYAAGLPLWSGAGDFEQLMAEVLIQLSRGFEPIPPVRLPEQARAVEQPLDPRAERFQQPSRRVFLTPRFHRRRSNG
jgi:hypothetical protein